MVCLSESAFVPNLRNQCGLLRRRHFGKRSCRMATSPSRQIVVPHDQWPPTKHPLIWESQNLLGLGVLQTQLRTWVCSEIQVVGRLLGPTKGVMGLEESRHLVFAHSCSPLWAFVDDWAPRRLSTLDCSSRDLEYKIYWSQRCLLGRCCCAAKWVRRRGHLNLGLSRGW